jgi:hypothetical protein
MGITPNGTRNEDAFTATRRIEEQGVQHLVEFLKEDGFDVFRLSADSHTMRELQLHYGDALIQRNEEAYIVEFKVEAIDSHDNFFLETWSNRGMGRRGWLDHLRTDWLLYYFLDPGDLYVFDFPKLRRWAFGSNLSEARIYRYPEKQQGKYAQRNDTWGRCVRIAHLVSEVSPKCYRRTGDVFIEKAVDTTPDMFDFN